MKGELKKFLSVFTMLRHLCSNLENDSLLNNVIFFDRVVLKKAQIIYPFQTHHFVFLYDNDLYRNYYITIVFHFPKAPTDPVFCRLLTMLFLWSKCDGCRYHWEAPQSHHWRLDEIRGSEYALFRCTRKSGQSNSIVKIVYHNIFVLCALYLGNWFLVKQFIRYHSTNPST